MMQDILNLIFLILILNAIVVPIVFGAVIIKLQTWQRKETQNESLLK